MVPQCSNPPHWPCHQQRLVNCDWMPAFYTSRQPSYSCRHPTCWAFSLRSHTFSKPGYLLYSVVTCPAGVNAWRLKSRHPFVPATQQLISSSDNKNNKRAAHWADHQRNAEWLCNLTRLRTSILNTGTHSPGMTLPRTAWICLICLCTGVGRFCSCLHKWGMASCGLWVWRRRTHHQSCCPPMSNPLTSWTAQVHSLMVLDNETIEWLLNTYAEI